MSMLDLSGWAAISEIIATFSIVISLLLVAYSIKRNTDEMESSNANFLYELDEQIAGDLCRNPGLASILVKVTQKEALSDTEKIQFVNLQHRNLTVWEIAWTQYKSGSLAFGEWIDWDQYKSETLKVDFPEEWWIEIRSAYKDEFAQHVDAKYADN